MDLFKERIDLYKKAVKFEKTDRIPTFSNYWTYMILDAGYKLSEGIYDLAKLENAVLRFADKYQFDGYNYTGNRNPFEVTEAFDGNKYLIDDEREVMNIKDAYLMEVDEFEEYMQAPRKFIWEKAVPRKCPGALAEDRWERFDQAVAAMRRFNEFNGRVAQRMREEQQVPSTNGTFSFIPFELFFNYFRGIKNSAVDLRRRYDRISAACKASEAIAGIPRIYSRLEGEQPDIFLHNGGFCFLGHSIMTQKQFEEFYWPYLKHAADICAGNGKTLHLFSEASIGRFDCMADIPKGVLDLQPEQDDVFELRKKFPQIALNGGMLSTVLGNGTKEECLDLAKKLVEELGPGFIMGQDKMMSFRNDAKPENILAVQKFCAEYKG